MLALPLVAKTVRRELLPSLEEPWEQYGAPLPGQHLNLEQRHKLVPLVAKKIVERVQQEQNDAPSVEGRKMEQQQVRLVLVDEPLVEERIVAQRVLVPGKPQPVPGLEERELDKLELREFACWEL